MIKSILKKIFPIKLLKDTFLVFNKIKIKTWDKLFFPEKIIPREQFLIFEETNPFLDQQTPTIHLEKEILEKLHLWLDPLWKLDQYFLYYKEAAHIEPQYGWAVTSDHYLIYPSLGFSKAPYARKPNLVKSYSSKKRVIRLSKIISLRDTGEENYFHFFNDVLAKLFFIEDQNFDLADFTIVISEKLSRKEFFRFFLESTHLKDFKWHVQRDEWIHFQEAIFCKPYTHTKKYFDTVARLVLPKSIVSRERRLFLTRSRKSLRYIENMDELKPLLHAKEFEIIDTETIKVAEQIQCFSECRYLVSIHGAGLVNVIFRQENPMTILEIIQPSDYIPFHYIMLARIYGYNYNALLGEKGVEKMSGGFRLNPDKLQSMIEAMLTK